MRRPNICLCGTAPEVVRVEIGAAGLDGALRGLSIGFLTDLHYGFFLGDKAAGRAFRRLMDEKPDLILLGGDLAEGRKNMERLANGVLRDLKAPLGVIAVPGNNDFEAVGGDYRALAEILARAGVRLAVNERVRVAAGGVTPPAHCAGIAISAIDEGKHGSPDCSVARLPVAAGDLHVVLTHSPWELADALPGSGARLALTGHTHGGQIGLPWAAMLQMGYRGARGRLGFSLTGVHEAAGAIVVVSNGVGCSLLPLRIGAWPQVHVITVR